MSSILVDFVESLGNTEDIMRISQRGPFALQALTVLAEHPAGVINQLRRSPTEISLGEVIRRIDGPSATFEDADSLRRRIHRDPKQRRLFRALSNVRDAVAGILDHTSLSDLCCRSRN